MTACDEDIAADVLARSRASTDALYVLDGSDTRAHLPALDGYWRDEEMPYDGQVRDGWRQFLYERAVADHGYDHWFCLLHSDEVWTFDPREMHARWPDADGFQFRASCYFPRAGEQWDYERSALDQLRWSLGPGWPEFRMFHGGPEVAFEPTQHFNTTPRGLRLIIQTDLEIKHYPFRSPSSQLARAQMHMRTGFDPDNYRHVLDGEIYWSDARIKEWQKESRQPGCWAQLRCD